MAKLAMVKHTWSRSPSADVSKVEFVLTVNGAETKTEFSGNEIESHTVEIRANSAVSFRIDTHDGEGNIVASETHFYSLGDLDTPLPATNLGHQILSIRDEEPTPPT